MIELENISKICSKNKVLNKVSLMIAAGSLENLGRCLGGGTKSLEEIFLRSSRNDGYLLKQGMI
ncbi:hypothetical protein K8S19_03295 [bacterium]|nr:hypothetical protein [bacterium]